MLSDLRQRPWYNTLYHGGMNYIRPSVSYSNWIVTQHNSLYQWFSIFALGETQWWRKHIYPHFILIIDIILKRDILDVQKHHNWSLVIVYGARWISNIWRIIFMLRSTHKINDFTIICNEYVIGKRYKQREVPGKTELNISQSCFIYCWRKMTRVILLIVGTSVTLHCLYKLIIVIPL